MGKRATRNGSGSDALQAVNLEALRAENLKLKEELERLRLSQAGAHPGATLVEAMKTADEAADTADDAVAMYGSAMLIRSELLTLLGLLKDSAADFEERLARLDHQVGLSLSGPGLNAVHLNGDSDDVIDLRDPSTQAIPVLVTASDNGHAAAANGA